MLKPPPFLTIITATYNAAKVLPNLVASLKEQISRDFEWIVIDGNSSDGTIDILRSSDAAISYWISEPDKGIYDAWNKALKHVSGQWILFLGADDVLTDEHTVTNIVKRLKPLPLEIIWSYAKITYPQAHGKNAIIGDPWNISALRFKSGMGVPHQATFHRKDFFTKFGEYDTTYRIAGDYALLLQSLDAHYEPIFFPDIISHMGSGGISSLPEMSLLTLREYKRARNKTKHYPTYTTVWCWSYFKALVKYYILKLFGRRLLSNVTALYRFITLRN